MLLFSPMPFDKVGMRDIAPEAGLSPASIYRYFSNRDDFVCRSPVERRPDRTELSEPLDGFYVSWTRDAQIMRLHTSFFTGPECSVTTKLNDFLRQSRVISIHFLGKVVICRKEFGPDK